jgi:uncharacterized protein YjbI with pentapeptide repeats
MKRAALVATLLAFTTFSCGQLVYAQAPSDTGGPIGNQAERDAIAARVRGGASCAHCDLFQIDLSYQNVAGRDFSGSRLRQSDMSLVIADRAIFRTANLSLVNAFGGRFSHADFTDANLNHGVAVGAYFGGARFSGAQIEGLNLSGAELAGAIGLTQQQLNTACGDATTTLPAGLSIPACASN